MFKALSNDGSTASIVELADVSSSLGLTQVLDDHSTRSVRQNRFAEEILVNPWQQVKTAVRRKSTPVCIDHAAPLSPLRDRDLVALSEFFDRDDLPNLEQDVNRHLLRLFPEPCWEDALSFVREFL